tara:strand:+ start:42 stop:392 length:351 start_codon:yes stop_codon:yes gene_type:complete
MKEKILKLLQQKKSINITKFIKLIPEIKGEYSMYMPVNPGLNEKILWLSNVNVEFISAFNELLVKDKMITCNPSNLMNFLIDGSPVYKDIKIFEKKYAKKQVLCWYPITVDLLILN